MTKISEVKYNLDMSTGNLIITLNDSFKLKESVFNNAIIYSDVDDNIVEIVLLNAGTVIERTITEYLTKAFSKMIK